MKPLFLEIQAFGPFADNQKIDFEKLGQNGMFLIKGKTGSGKTTIFDAMTMALYGGSSGDGERIRSGRNDLKEWRCMQAIWGVDTVVSFTFSVHEHKYNFTRKLVCRRTNLVDQFEAGEIDDEGNLIPFFENPRSNDLTNKATELIGLTKEQFRQVVLLPQGQFEKFLIASSSDKEDILKNIFGTERWSKYADKFLDEANKRKKLLDEEKGEINNSLGEEDLSSIDELRDVIEKLREDQVECESKHLAYKGSVKQEELNRDISLAERFKPLHELEQKKAVLEKNKSNIDNKRRVLDEAERAEKLRRPISEYEAAEGDARERHKALAYLEQLVPDGEQKQMKAEEAKKQHIANSPVNELNKTIGLYKSKTGIYESIDNYKTIYSKLEVEYYEAEKNLEEKEKNLESAVEIALEKKNEYDAEDNEAREYRNKYYAGIYGEIASEIKAGEKCPVCGSENHPSLAKKLPDSISKTDLDRQEMKAEKAKKNWELVEKFRSEIEEKEKAIRELCDEKKQGYIRAKTEYEKASEGLITGISDLRVLKAAIAEAEGKIEAYENEGIKLQQEYENAVRSLVTLKESINGARFEAEKADKNIETARKVMEEALSLNGFANPSEAKALLKTDAERSAFHTEIVKHDNSVKITNDELNKKRAELSEKSEPDSSKFVDRQKEINDESEEYNKTISKLNERISRLKDKLSNLERKQQHYDVNIQQAETDLAFAKKLRGDAGVGIQRYVLAIMFNQIIGEANRMLAKVHGGRYHLFRTDEKGVGNQRGLELKVYDNRSPENKDGRSVKMLSGGEKFLVSLALSIGMSTVAQNSGVQIESLFIDEGFGTLDDSSIQDAMDVLENVRKGTGTIGIISHVQLLEANIPMHLEVIKEETGSRVRME